MRWKRYHRFLAPERLELERRAMEQEYPFFALQQDKDGCLSWRGQIRTAFGPRYHVLISYTRMYPLNEPHIYVESPRVRSIFLDQGEKGRKICRRTRGGQWRPATSTVVVTVRQAAEWAHRVERAKRRGLPFRAPLTGAEKRRCLDELKTFRPPSGIA